VKRLNSYEQKNGTWENLLNLKKWDFDRLIPIWIKDAAIEKHITYRFRHTYATFTDGRYRHFTVSKRQMKTQRKDTGQLSFVTVYRTATPEI
jgi:hypothetical protein